MRFVVFAALVLASCGQQPAAPPKPHVSVAYPIVRKVVDWDDYVGQFQAVQNVTITPRVSGPITQVLFRNGQDVKAGQALFIIDPRPFKAVYDQAVANLAQARAAQADAAIEYADAEALMSAHALSQEIHDSRLAALRTANANVDADKAAIESARLNVEFTTVTASVSGRISQRLVSIGTVVVANTTPLTTIVTLDPIWFAFEGAESFYLKYVREDLTGQRRSSRYAPNPVEIQLADETDFPHRGRMAFVDNAIDTNSGTIKAYAELPNPGGFLTPGMFGRVRLLGSGAYQAMLIPDEAIVTDQSRRLVYVVGKNGVVAERPIESGPLVVGLRVVRSGLLATDKVVLDGLASLQPGMQVETTLVKLTPRAKDTSPRSAPLLSPPPAEATPR
jgi:RND family efflux transporter MFP subunit